MLKKAEDDATVDNPQESHMILKILSVFFMVLMIVFLALMGVGFVGKGEVQEELDLAQADNANKTVQITNLTKELETVKAQNSALQQQLSILNANVSALQKSVAELNSTMQTQSAEISSLTWWRVGLGIGAGVSLAAAGGEGAYIWYLMHNSSWSFAGNIGENAKSECFGCGDTEKGSGEFADGR